MDAATLGFLAVVVLASGLIAYVADLLGRKLGKKRLTLGGLRPRHTAALMTVLSGMGISVLTILLVMAISADVRDWILRGNLAIVQAQERQLVVRRLEAEAKTAGDMLKDLASQKSKLEARNKELAQAIESQRSQIATLKDRRHQAETQLAGANRRAADATRGLSQAARTLAMTKASLKSERKNLVLARQQLDVAMVDKNNAEKEWARLDNEVRNREAELRDAESRLASRERDVKDLDARIVGLTSSLAQAQGRLATATEQYNDVQYKLDASKLELDRLQAQVQQLRQGFEGNLASSRLKPQVVSVGQEMARIQLEPRQSQEDVAAALETALTKARKAAEDIGVKPRSGGPAASLKDQQTKDGKIITVAQQKAAVVRSATGLPDQSVIIVSSIWNVFEGEDVPLVAAAYRNPLVYRQSQIVGETRIDGTKEDEVIIRQLTDFLTQRIRQKALSDGMIPNAEGLGQVPFSDLFALAREIKDARRQVRLVALARQDTRAADPLRLDLRLR